jgi:uncharacterized protein YbjT (DUF2867 family)
MNIVVTGSLGHIGKPLTEALVRKGHTVTVVSSKADKAAGIEALGARAAIGTLEDPDFLAETFAGAGVVYAMIPPNFGEVDFTAYYKRIATHYANAIQKAGISRVVYLSSFGAHTDEGVGIIAGAYNAEQILGAIPGLALTSIRPTSFFYNFENYIPSIRNAGAIYTNYGDALIPLVAPADIAAAIAEEIEAPAQRRKVRYVASDERTGAEAARLLGAAIGMPDLQWIVVSDEAARQGMEGAGIPAKLAADLAEMYGALRAGGRMVEEYWKHKPALGPTKLESYVPDFANAYAKN